MQDPFDASPGAGPPPFRAVIEAARDAVIVTDARLDRPGPSILYVNPAFTRMTGYAPDEVVGRTPRLLQGPDSDRSEIGRMRETLLAGALYHGQSVNHRKGGETYVVDGLIAPVHGADGAIVSWLAIQRDVTAERVAGERLRREAEALEQRVRAVLASVRALAQRSAEASGSLEHCAMHLDGRIEALGRVHAALLRDPAAGLDLAALVAEELRAHAAREGERVSLDGPPLLLTARAAECIGLGVHELAANAVKYGALAAGDGRLAVAWTIEEHADGPWLALTWKESGLRGVAAPRHFGFGTDHLARTLAHEIGAAAALDYEPDGLRCTIRVPLTERVLWAERAIRPGSAPRTGSGRPSEWRSAP